jgi:hypothetical protein
MTFQDALIGSLKNLATRIYLESQKTVPVKTGELKGSGSVKHPGTPNKISVITYTAPYAQMVNQTHGASSGKSWGGLRDEKMTVKAHKRTYPSGKTVTVQKHKKKVGARPAGTGNGFLTKALRSELSSFVRDEFPDKQGIIVNGLGF